MGELDFKEKEEILRDCTINMVDSLYRHDEDGMIMYYLKLGVYLENWGFLK